MDLRSWRKVLLQWVSECQFIEANYITLEQTDIEAFFAVYVQRAQAEAVVQKALQAAQKVQRKKHRSPLQAFIREIYPEFCAHIGGRGQLVESDYLYVYTLLLHYSCVKQPSVFFHSICKKLPELMQTCIAALLNMTVEPQLTREFLRQTIANVASVYRLGAQDSPCPPSSSSSPNLHVDVTPSSSSSPASPQPQSSTPRMHHHHDRQRDCLDLQMSVNEMSAPSTPKTELLDRRTRELRGFRSQLDMERYEKNLLEEQNLEKDAIIKNLQKSYKSLEAKMAKMTEAAQISDEDEVVPNFGPNEFDRLKRSLMKEISHKDEIIAETNDKLQDLHNEKSDLAEKLKQSAEQLMVCMDRVRELELRLEDLSLTLSKKDYTISSLERDKQELDLCLQEAREELHSRREVLNSSSDLLTCSLSPNVTPENLASSVIDKQLREKEQENVRLREELQKQNASLHQLTESMASLLRKHELDQDISAPLITSISVNELAENSELQEKCDKQASNLDKLLDKSQTLAECLESQRQQLAGAKAKIAELEQEAVQTSRNHASKLFSIQRECEVKLQVLQSDHQRVIQSHDELNKKLVTTECELANIRIKLAVKEQQADRLSSEILEVRATKESLECGIDKFDAHFKEITKLLEQEQRCLEYLRAKYAQCRNQLISNNADMGLLSCQLGSPDWQSTLQRIDELCEMKEQHEALKLEHEQRVSEATELWIRLEQSEEQYKALKREHEQQVSEATELRIRLEQSEEQHEALKVEHEQQVSEATELRIRLEQCEEQHEALKREHEQQVSEATELRIRLEQSEEQHEALKVEHEQQVSEATELRIRLEQCEEQHEALKREHEQQVSEATQLRIRLEQSEEQREQQLQELNMISEQRDELGKRSVEFTEQIESRLLQHDAQNKELLEQQRKSQQEKEQLLEQQLKLEQEKEQLLEHHCKFRQETDSFLKRITGLLNEGRSETFSLLAGGNSNRFEEVESWLEEILGHQKKTNDSLEAKVKNLLDDLAVVKQEHAVIVCESRQWAIRASREEEKRNEFIASLELTAGKLSTTLQQKDAQIASSRQQVAQLQQNLEEERSNLEEATGKLIRAQEQLRGHRLDAIKMAAALKARLHKADPVSSHLKGVNEYSFEELRQHVHQFLSMYDEVDASHQSLELKYSRATSLANHLKESKLHLEQQVAQLQSQVSGSGQDSPMIKQLKDTIANLERVNQKLSSDHVELLNRQMDMETLKATLMYDSQKVKEKLQKQLKAAEDEVSNLELKYQGQIDELKAEIAEQRCKNLENEMAGEKEDVSQLSKEQDTLSDIEKEELKGKLEANEAKLLKLKEEHDQVLKSAKKEYEQRYKDLETQLKESSQLALNAIAKELEEVRLQEQQHRETIASHVNVMEDLQQSQLTEKSLRQTIETHKQLLNDMCNELNGARDARLEREKEVDTLKAHIKEMETEYQVKIEQLKQSKTPTEQQMFQSKLEANEAKLLKLHEEHDQVLKSAKKEYEQRYKELETQLKESSQLALNAIAKELEEVRLQEQQHRETIASHGNVTEDLQQSKLTEKSLRQTIETHKQLLTDMCNELNRARDAQLEREKEIDTLIKQIETNYQTKIEQLKQSKTPTEQQKLIDNSAEELLSLQTQLQDGQEELSNANDFQKEQQMAKVETHSLQAKLQEEHELTDQLKAQLDEKQKELHSAEVEMRSLQTRLQDEQKLTDLLKAELDEQRNELHSARVQLQSDASRTEQLLNEQAEELARAKAALESQAAEVSAKLVAERESAQREIYLVKERMTKAEREHQVQLATLEDDLATLSERQTQTEAHERIIELENQRLIMEKDISKLNEQLTEFDKLSTRLNSEIAQQKKRLAERNDQVKSLEYRLHVSTDMLSESQEKLAKVTARLTQVEQANQMSASQQAKLQQRLEEEMADREKDRQELAEITKQLAEVQQQLDGTRLVQETQHLEFAEKAREIEQESAESAELARYYQRRMEQLEEQLADSNQKLAEMRAANESQMTQQGPSDLGATYSKSDVAESDANKEDAVLRNNQLALDCQILQAKYRDAKDEIQRCEQKIKDQRLEMEGKLDKMKTKMDGPHSLDDSMSALLSSSSTGTRKKTMGTHYKRPGPPTPSKNGGRLSFGSSEPPREILREFSDHNNTSKTPARFKFLTQRFSVGSSTLPRDELPHRKRSNLLAGIQRRKLRQTVGLFCTSTPRKSRSYYDQQRLIRASDADTSSADAAATGEEEEQQDEQEQQGQQEAEMDEANQEGTPHLSTAALLALTKGNTRRLTGPAAKLRNGRVSLCLHGNIFAKSSRPAVPGKRMQQHRRLRQERMGRFDQARHLDQIRLSANLSSYAADSSESSPADNNNYSLHNRNEKHAVPPSQFLMGQTVVLDKRREPPVSATFCVNADADVDADVDVDVDVDEVEVQHSETWQLLQQFESENLATSWASQGGQMEQPSEDGRFEQLCQETECSAPFQLQPLIYEPVGGREVPPQNRLQLETVSSSNITGGSCSTTANMTSTSSRQSCTVYSFGSVHMQPMPHINITYVQPTATQLPPGSPLNRSLWTRTRRRLRHLSSGQRMIVGLALLLVVALGCLLADMVVVALTTAFTVFGLVLLTI
ncbi:nuclear mitotic apparatus protein 1 isoform X2 [Drosophila elegans]|uniref:nuclear mitotic apparatus protein 1 isoform X2 n=1 Tax=Drosophila elegans TaxID=30023 RepID=UPI001BC83830|nr:nuclear mitotic apparatus protein 1 isoform X2 [Drosophila elegans]